MKLLNIVIIFFVKIPQTSSTFGTASANAGVSNTGSEISSTGLGVSSPLSSPLSTSSLVSTVSISCSLPYKKIREIKILHIKKLHKKLLCSFIVTRTNRIIGSIIWTIGIFAFIFNGPSNSRFGGGCRCSSGSSLRHFHKIIPWSPQRFDVK